MKRSLDIVEERSDHSANKRVKYHSDGEGTATRNDKPTDIIVMTISSECAAHISMMVFDTELCKKTMFTVNTADCKSEFKYEPLSVFDILQRWSDNGGISIVDPFPYICMYELYDVHGDHDDKFVPFKTSKEAHAALMELAIPLEKFRDGGRSKIPLCFDSAKYRVTNFFQCFSFE